MRKKKLYVVGWPDEDDCIYGKSTIDGNANYVNALTFKQAGKELKLFPSKDAVIYKLVPVKELIPYDKRRLKSLWQNKGKRKSFSTYDMNFILDLLNENTDLVEQAVKESL